MAQDNSLLLEQINDMMKEYKMLVEFKSNMEKTYSDLEERILKMTANLAKPSHVFISSMEANKISVQKEIKDAIMQMKNVKKDIIDLTMKQMKMDSDENSDSWSEVAKELMKQLNGMSNDQIMKDMKDNSQTESTYDEDDFSEDIDNILDSLEVNKEKEHDKQVNNDLDSSENHSMKSLMDVYSTKLNFYVTGNSPEEYNLIVTDKDLNVIDDEDLEKDYHQLYVLSQDLDFHDMEGNDEQVEDEFGNIYYKAQ